MNALATVVACFGLLADSAAVVIGAMVIALLLGPITGISLALIDGEMRLLRKSLLAEFAGILAVIAVAFVIGIVFKEIPPGKEILTRTTPNILDLMIALGGGAAGAYATVAPRLNLGLVGVAIATALVPPLSVFGIMLARGETSLALGGLLLFLTNIVAIQFASSVVLWFHGYHQITRLPQDRKNLILRNGVSFTLLLVLVVVLGFNLKQSVAKQQMESAVRASLQKALRDYPGSRLVELGINLKNNKLVIRAVIRTPSVITPPQVAALSAKIPLPDDMKKPELLVRSVITAETNSSGYVFEPLFSPAEK
jgi:uncharacterized hydrophobic protein (TIGR00271 family)